MKFKIIKSLLLSSVLLSSLVNSTKASELPPIDSHPTLTDAFKVTGGLIALVAGYQLANFGYDCVKNYLEEKMLDKAADALVIALTPNFTLMQLPHNERQEILRKKARLINMRKRVIIKLNIIVNAIPNTLSEKHCTILKKEIKRTEKFFKMLDLFRKTNPYEKEYETASLEDELIESSLVKSITLNAKPNEECTEQELQQKQIQEERRTKIIKKLKTRVNSIVLEQIMKSSLFFNVL